MPNLGIIASSISGHLNPPYDPGAYYALASATVGAGGATSIQFAGIPTDYKHLQIRGIGRTNYGSGSDFVGVVLNNDRTTTYRTHQLFGNGTSMVSNSYTATTDGMYAQRIGGNSVSYFGGLIIDFLDYTNTNKNKVMRSLGGVDYNGSSEGQVYFNSGLYPVSNTVISSITLFGGVNSFQQYSSFALYGVK